MIDVNMDIFASTNLSQVLIRKYGHSGPLLATLCHECNMPYGTHLYHVCQADVNLSVRVTVPTVTPVSTVLATLNKDISDIDAVQNTLNCMSQKDRQKIYKWLHDAHGHRLY